jgi:hypothetical protein
MSVLIISLISVGAVIFVGVAGLIGYKLYKRRQVSSAVTVNASEALVET